MDDNNKPHVRRVRYKGTHPRTYKEKYKELNPEKYGDIIEKVISKRSTPAGMHISIMVDEIMDVLDIKPGCVGLDATFGYGGHSLAILEKLEGKGHLYSLDVDPIEIVKSEKRLRDKGFDEDILTVVRTNFANVDQVCKDAKVEFDFLMADLGVSSMQIDNPERGFTYKYDGPLDLRLDPTKGTSAAKRLLELDFEELAGMLYENSDEPYANEIAREVIKRNKGNDKILTTKDFKNAIEKAIEKKIKTLPENEKKEVIKKTCQRSFQALRIDVNSEFEVLYTFLDKLPHVMKSGGRIAILTFHSGEDRLVKKAFKAGLVSGLYSEISEEVIRPSSNECARNPRAHSAKLRWAVKA